MVFTFFRFKTLRSIGALNGLVDYHSHLLPGVDDGVKTVEETLQILHAMEKQGTKAVWLTPHIMEDIPNETTTLQQKYKELKSAYKGNIQLHLAAEYMLDTLFEERLESNDLLSLGKEGNHLLVETSFFNPPYNFHDILDHIKEKGYTPVLAHPERYLYMQESDYKKLKETNIHFQLNLFSLTGAYGKEAQKKAEWLVKHQMYDLKGTDTHSLAQYERGIKDKLNMK